MKTQQRITLLPPRGKCISAPMTYNHCLKSRKYLTRPFRPFLVQICPFWPKIDIWAYIFQTVIEFCRLLNIDTSIMVFLWKIDIWSPGKIWPRPFQALFGPQPWPLIKRCIRKMICKGFKRKNVLPEYLQARKKGKENQYHFSVARRFRLGICF